MWANSFWGLFGFTVTFGLAVLLLSPEQAWLRPWLLGASIACGVLSAIVLCWPLRHPDNRIKVRDALRHPRRWIRKTLEPIHIIVLGLVIVLTGVIWQWRNERSLSTTVSGTTSVATGPTVPPPPIQGSNVTTHLTLQFGQDRMLPVATALENIWRWYALANIVVVIGKDGKSNEIITWTVFLTLDRPVNPQQVLVTSLSSLPRYEVKDRDSRSVVVAFVGDLTDIAVDIRVVGSVVPAPMVAAPPIAPTHYTERDIRELLDALAKAQELDRDKISQTIFQIQTTAANWVGIYRNQNLVAKLKELRTRLQTDVWDPIDELVYDNHDKDSLYIQQMRAAFALDDEAAKGELTRSFQPAIDAIGKLPPNPPEETLQLVSPQFAELLKQANVAYQWYIKLHDRIPQMMQSLRTNGVTGYEKK